MDMSINKTRINSTKVSLQAQINAIHEKYSVDAHTIEMGELSLEDQSLYLALDESIQLYNEILRSTQDVVIKENR
jgi:hypothetical protein